VSEESDEADDSAFPNNQVKVSQMSLAILLAVLGELAKVYYMNI
jgi:hypothetical protein